MSPLKKECLQTIPSEFTQTLATHLTMMQVRKGGGETLKQKLKYIKAMTDGTELDRKFTADYALFWTCEEYP